MYIAVIGIDRYRTWSPLHNAVQDARGALNAFEELGFEQVRPPLLDEAATGDALRHLVTDELSGLGTNDSLVVFFAGHGHTETTAFPDGTCVKKGYLMPVDAEPRGGRMGTWLRLDSWLSEVAQLRPMHILVVLDACHSGIALDPVFRWRGNEAQLAEPLEQLRARRSRRIITSALDGQLAMDGGPATGHSLFTGCLIDALAGGVFASVGRPAATGSEIWSHVRRRVIDYPSSEQTPDFGAFELDNRGELIIELPMSPQPPPRPDTHEGKRQSGPHEIWSGKQGPGASSPISAETSGADHPRPRSGPDSIKSKRATTAPPATTAPAHAGSPAPAPAAGRPAPAQRPDAHRATSPPGQRGTTPSQAVAAPVANATSTSATPANTSPPGLEPFETRGRRSPT